MKNEQQNFWRNTYAQEYMDKNKDFNQKDGVDAWSQILRKTSDIKSFLECGSNIGRNIGFLNDVLPNASKSLIELNPQAFEFVTNQYGIDKSFNGAIVDSKFLPKSFDLVFTIGVLIHIHPDDLLENMRKMFEYSAKYIVIGEYFNRTPVMIEYQGEINKLFKRDFGKYFLEHFAVNLVDYGFLWGHLYDDSGFDDITWWVFEKRSI
jgi:pseudaminic acid biosynthesis-associated methylase